MTVASLTASQAEAFLPDNHAINLGMLFTW
jgi:hypothetical protein